jgi:hypothetical protein
MCPYVEEIGVFGIISLHFDVKVSRSSNTAEKCERSVTLNDVLGSVKKTNA